MSQSTGESVRRQEVDLDHGKSKEQKPDVVPNLWGSKASQGVDEGDDEDQHIVRELCTQEGGPIKLHGTSAPTVHSLNIILSLFGNAIGDEAWEVHRDEPRNVFLGCPWRKRGQEEEAGRRETETERDRDREREKEIERDRQRQRETERQRDRERRDRERQRQR
jgi:hypothetical protein